MGEEEKSFETFPLRLGAGGSGTAWRGAGPGGGRTWGPQAAPFLTASDACSLAASYTATPVPDQPSEPRTLSPAKALPQPQAHLLPVS